ncbi:DnaJ domain-containing protein [Sporormia fimetaria CBS 119925]|uniref:DnaJ domain-containing protein n=1 Tax=Sporormia fimetaria CBS 119925 TaxID=1340428 RepID=A0A6A6VS75_9PLEO|nr:DnaJ domain-containing protein [Sporormia fimetaria CBS 119925]
MGAQQSTGGGSAPTDSAVVKTSYYELLGVERSATNDELKKAYRRKALELHPDRNYGDVERTTALFAEVQSAYEVLSDSQERAWYDAHEMDILRGGAGEGGAEEHFDHNMRMTTADEVTRMMGKFRGKVDFSDAPTGFFGFVRETFEQLAKEEEHAADWEGVDIPSYPSFGHKDDTYEDVVRDFYAIWNGFATRKSFAWKDKYRLSEAPDRRIRRLMEKENQKLREAGVREYNDAVRALVAFVRKRDPRYTPNTQTEAQRAEAQRASAKAQAARARAARAAEMKGSIPDWATRRDPDEEELQEEEEIEEEHFECVACNKTFKHERQWEAHEKSKKHQKAMYALKRKMQKENAHLNLDEDVTGSGTFTPMDDELSADGADAEPDDLEGDVANGVSNLRVDDSASDVPPAADESDDEKKSSEHVASPVQDADGLSEDDEYATRSDVEARLAGSKSQTPSGPASDEDSADAPQTNAPKLGKAAQKRAKRAAKQAEMEQTQLKNKCLGCDAAFETKNQLFQHLKDHPKHAAPVSATKAGGKKKGKKK